MCMRRSIIILCMVSEGRKIRGRDGDSSRPAANRTLRRCSCDHLRLEFRSTIRCPRQIIGNFGHAPTEEIDRGETTEPIHFPLPPLAILKSPKPAALAERIVDLVHDDVIGSLGSGHSLAAGASRARSHPARVGLEIPLVLGPREIVEFSKRPRRQRRLHLGPRPSGAPHPHAVQVPIGSGRGLARIAAIAIAIARARALRSLEQLRQREPRQRAVLAVAISPARSPPGVEGQFAPAARGCGALAVDPVELLGSSPRRIAPLGRFRPRPRPRGVGAEPPVPKAVRGRARLGPGLGRAAAVPPALQILHALLPARAIAPRSEAQRS